jgi:pimeloyl-ACP methyl ester carboxylesterase
MTVHQIELSAGTIEYQDSGGDGPAVVLLHGLLMDASLWDDVIAALSVDHRCLAPTLPLGVHRHPMGAGADLSLRGIARLVAELLERLDLLASCDAFDNHPPGPTGRALVLTGKLSPTLFGAFMQQLRLRPVRRLPFTFGWLTIRGDAATARWLEPILQRPEIRRDAVHALRAVSAEPDLLVEASRCLPTFDRPALVVWAREDRVMPPAHGRRLVGLLPRARLVEVADSYTLIPLDQPARLAQIIRNFTHELDTATP